MTSSFFLRDLRVRRSGFAMHHCHVSCAEQRGFVVQHDPHRNALHQWTQTTFVAEGIHETRFAQFRKNLGGNPSADVHPMHRENFQSEIACGCSIDLGKNIHRPLAQRTLSAQAVTRNHHGMIVAILELLSQPGLFLTFAGLAQKFVDTELAGAGEYAFPAHVPVLFVQVVPQFGLQIVGGTEVCVSAFSREWNVASAVPK